METQSLHRKLFAINHAVHSAYEGEPNLEF